MNLLSPIFPEHGYITSPKEKFGRKKTFISHKHKLLFPQSCPCGLQMKMPTINLYTNGLIIFGNKYITIMLQKNADNDNK